MPEDVEPSCLDERLSKAAIISSKARVKARVYYDDDELNNNNRIICIMQVCRLTAKDRLNVNAV